MRKNKSKKQFKADNWNEISRNSEEAKTKEEDREWNEKNDELKEVLEGVENEQVVVFSSMGGGSGSSSLQFIADILLENNIFFKNISFQF